MAGAERGDWVALQKNKNSHRVLRLAYYFLEHMGVNYG